MAIMSEHERSNEQEIEMLSNSLTQYLILGWISGTIFGSVVTGIILYFRYLN